MNALHFASLLALSAPAWSQAEPAAPLPDETTAAVDKATLDAPTQRGLQSLGKSFSIRDLMTRPLVTEPKEGQIWVRTRDMRMGFGPEGAALYPVFGSASPQEWPVAFASVTATRDGVDLGVNEVSKVTESGDSVSLERGALREVYHLDLDSIEQTFVFDSLPGTGDLVVRMGVETELTPVLEGGVLRFAHPTLGEVRYGDAFVFDAEGRRAPIQREWNGSEIVLTVPATFLDEATLPVTIDPPLTAFANNFGVADDSNPDIAFGGFTNEYFVCWEEFTSQINADVYLTSFGTNGSQGSSIAIDVSNNSWNKPRLAYHGQSHKLLIVADDQATFVTQAAVVGQLVDSASMTTSGAPFFISAVINSGVFQPDVGSTTSNSFGNDFLVVWSGGSLFSNQNVQYAIVGSSGQVGNPIDVTSGTEDDNLSPTVSDSQGDTSIPGPDYWTIAWIKDDNNDGLGQVWARRVHHDGNPIFGSGNFLVEQNTQCANPSATSRFDAPVASWNDRPSIVAYDRLFTNQRSIYANVVVDGHAFPSNAISLDREDYFFELDQWGPSVATDGKCFLMSYSEEYFANIGTGDFDMYMVSGNLSFQGNDVFMALAERHQNMAFTAAPEVQGRVCSERDGDPSSTSDNGACIWTAMNPGSTNGQLAGTILDCATFQGSAQIAVGIQYCDANPNSAGKLNSSWLSINGTQSIAGGHQAFCIDMPTNVFGLLAAARNSGNINMPGNSMGRLCLSGPIGRFSSQIQSSGAQGTMSVVIDPASIPQPSGAVAAVPGETWYFQVWHRDNVNGTSTSNFSNACRLTFLP